MQKDVSGLEIHVGYWLRFVSNHVSHAFTQKVESQGVTVAEWVLMRQMYASGRVPPSELAAGLGMTRGAVSKLVERLCQKQMASRSSETTDRRYQSVELTTRGKRLVPILAKLADEKRSAVFGHLSEKQQSNLLKQMKELVQRHGWKDSPIQ